jgi:hypothetical protein
LDRQDPVRRAQEIDQRRLVRQDPVRRAQETTRRRLVRQDPVHRAQEQVADNDRRRGAREQRPIHHEMATNFDRASRSYLFNQPCRMWNVKCCQGCGYIHLSSSMPSTRRKCCANGLLSEASLNFDQDPILRFALNQLPAFVKSVSYSQELDQQSTKYNNLLAMAATKVCNYTGRGGFTNRGPGNHCVTLSGRVHHFFLKVSSSNPQSCGLSYFIFDNSAARLCSSEAGNVNKNILNIIANGLKRENPYCKDLQNLGMRVREGILIPDANVFPRMADQPAWKSMTILSVMNCRWTGTTTLQVTTTDGSISNVSIDSEMVEGLCFPVLFTHGEPGYTNDLKSNLSPTDYIMSRMLMPEKIGAEYMIALVKYEGDDIIDSRTGERSVRNSEDTENMEEIHGQRYLRTNLFMVMSRLALYWLLDFFSHVRDHRLSIIDQLRDRIMMGQQRQKRRTCNVADDLEMEERRGAGCVDLVSGQRGPFPRLKLTKACWTCPPPLDA